MVLVALALAPAIAIIIFILYKDKSGQRAAGSLFVSFFLGVAVAFPVLLLEMDTNYPELKGGLTGTVIASILFVTALEELAKFIPLRLYAFTRKSFDEPLDGMIHAVMIGMGFATLQNIIIVYEYGLQIGFVRMLANIPAHAVFGVVIGYFAGKAKFSYGKQMRLIPGGILITIFIHLLYDAGIFLGKQVNPQITTPIVITAVALFFIILILSSRFIKSKHLIMLGLHKTGSRLTTRNATANDAGLIRSLAKQIWPNTYRKILPAAQIKYMMNLIYSEAAIAKQIAEGHQFIIIYNSGRPVGFASYEEIGATTFKLQKIYVLKSQRGLGTGQFIIKHVLHIIRPKGATVLRLNVNRFNKARKFYERMGFDIIDQEKIDIGNGYFMDDYVMEKKLGVTLPEVSPQVN